MKNFREAYTRFLQDEDIRKDIREMMRPLIQIMYNEAYLYLWLLCFYNLFLFVIVLAILIILIRILNNSKITILA